MQIDKLYPTSGTTNFDFDTTAVFMSLPEDFNTEMGEQYLMGYCDTEHMPACCTPVYFNQTAGELTFLADYSRNYGFGFASWGYTGGAAPGNLYYIDGDENLVRSWGVDYDFAFINHGEMCRVNADTTIDIYINCASIPAALYDGEKCSRLLGSGTEAGGIIDGWFSYSYNDFVDIITNDTPIIDGTYTASGVQFNITVRPSDFGDSHDPNARHYVAWDAGNGFYVFFCIFGFRMSGNTPVYYNEQQYPANITPFFTIPHTTTDKKSIIAPGSYVMGGVRFSYSNGAFTGIQQGGNFGYNQATEFINNVVYGSYNNGALSVNDVNWSEAALGSNRRNVFFIRNFYGAFLGAGEFRFYSIYTPRDIYNYLCLYHKHTSIPSDNYSSEDTVTVFTNSNVPTLKTVSGTLSDIQLDLQPWQYPGIDITVNTFTPTDIPDPGCPGKNLIRFGAITPSEFLFGDISIEKIYFGSSLLYQKFVPEQYVKLNPTDKFISEKTSVDDYRIYGELPEGDIILSVRTPRTKNLLPYPYSGIETGPGGSSWDPRTYYNYPDAHLGLVITDHGDGTFEWVNQTTANHKSSIAFEDQRVLYSAGTYTMSHAPGTTYIPQLGIWAYDENGTQIGSSLIDDNPGWYGRGYVTFTYSVPFYLRTVLFASNAYSYSGGYSRPQLEAGSDVTEYEPPNEPTLTTITLPRALEENEYISYADQKIMPTGTPLVVPKLKTIVGENVIMIENYPRATNTITLTPATKE